MGLFSRLRAAGRSSASGERAPSSSELEALRLIDEGNAPDEIKRIEHAKLTALLAICETAECRRRAILAHFGESHAGGCRHCDTCRNPVETWDGTEAAIKALAAIYRTGQRFGAGHVIDVLLGKETETSLPEGACDLAFLCDTYHHFEYPRRMMTSILKALKPGGKLVVIDFIREEGKSSKWTMDHVRADQATVEKEITECGFRKTREGKGVLKENYIVFFEKAKADKGE